MKRSLSISLVQGQGQCLRRWFVQAHQLVFLFRETFGENCQETIGLLITSLKSSLFLARSTALLKAPSLLKTYSRVMHSSPTLIQERRHTTSLPLRLRRLSIKCRIIDFCRHYIIYVIE